MSQRRLLHVFSTFKVGGPQRRFAQLCAHLGPDYHHTIASMDDRWEALGLISKDVSCEKLDLSQRLNSGFETLRTARQTLNKRKPDLLVTYNWGAIEWAAANLFPICPHVHIEDGFRPDEVEGRLWRRNLFRRLVLRGNSRVVVISETLHRIALDEWKIPTRRVQFIPNGIDVEKYRKTSSNTLAVKLGIESGDIVIGTVAALRPEKDLAALLRVFAQLDRSDGVKLLICGDGPERAELEWLTTSLQIEKDVIFMGYSDSPEDALALMHIFALSSRTEQMPLSILEAMAAGLPVASYAVGDVAGMVAQDNAPYVVPREETRLQDALQALIGSAKLREDIGKSNFVRVGAAYTQDKMYGAYRSLFDADA